MFACSAKVKQSSSSTELQDGTAATLAIVYRGHKVVVFCGLLDVRLDGLTFTGDVPRLIVKPVGVLPLKVLHVVLSLILAQVLFDQLLGLLHRNVFDERLQRVLGIRDELASEIRGVVLVLPQRLLGFVRGVGVNDLLARLRVADDVALVTLIDRRRRPPLGLLGRLGLGRLTLRSLPTLVLRLVTQVLVGLRDQVLVLAENPLALQVALFGSVQVLGDSEVVGALVFRKVAESLVRRGEARRL